MKTHGTCEKRGRDKRDEGSEQRWRATPGEMANDRAGLVWQWDYATPKELGGGVAGKARVTDWRGDWERYSGDIPSLELPASAGLGLSPLNMGVLTPARPWYLALSPLRGRVG